MGIDQPAKGTIFPVSTQSLLGYYRLRTSESLSGKKSKTAVTRPRTAVVDMEVMKRSFFETCIVGKTSSPAGVERKLANTRWPRVMLQPYRTYVV